MHISDVRDIVLSHGHQLGILRKGWLLSHEPPMPRLILSVPGKDGLVREMHLSGFGAKHPAIEPWSYGKVTARIVFKAHAPQLAREAVLVAAEALRHAVDQHPVLPWTMSGYRHPPLRLAVRDHVVAELRALRERGGSTEAHATVTGELADLLVWIFTQTKRDRFWKYNLRFVSFEARTKLEATNGAGKWEDGLVHEHVFQRALLVERLLAIEPADIGLVLHDAVACVVTKQEHRRLGAVQGFDGWDRYRAAGVRVWDRHHGCEYEPSAIPVLGDPD